MVGTGMKRLMGSSLRGSWVAAGARRGTSREADFWQNAPQKNWQGFEPAHFCVALTKLRTLLSAGANAARASYDGSEWISIQAATVIREGIDDGPSSSGNQLRVRNVGVCRQKFGSPAGAYNLRGSVRSVSVRRRQLVRMELLQTRDSIHWRLGAPPPERPLSSGGSDGGVF